jgi:hypothetical protein
MLLLARDRAGVASDASVLIDYETVAQQFSPYSANSVPVNQA